MVITFYMKLDKKAYGFKHKRNWKTSIHNFPTCSSWEIMNINDAYLAGLIDGEGTMNNQSMNTIEARISRLQPWRVSTLENFKA